MKLIPLIAVASLFTCSCFLFPEPMIRTYYAPTWSGDAKTPAVESTKPWDIAVYRTEKPAGPVEEIGTVYVDSTYLPKAIDPMRLQAAKAGGDAIIDIKITSDGIVGTVVRVAKP